MKWNPFNSNDEVWKDSWRNEAKHTFDSFIWSVHWASIVSIWIDRLNWLMQDNTESICGCKRMKIGCRLNRWGEIWERQCNGQCNTDASEETPSRSIEPTLLKRSVGAMVLALSRGLILAAEEVVHWLVKSTQRRSNHQCNNGSVEPC